MELENGKVQPMTTPSAPVLELRVALTTNAYERVVEFY